MVKTVQVPYITGISWLAKTYYLHSNNSLHWARHTDTEKQTAMRNHKQHTYHMWLTTDTQTFSSFLHTVTLHVIVFNLMGGYQAFKAAHYLHLHHQVTTKHHTTHCQNADATIQVVCWNCSSHSGMISCVVCWLCSVTPSTADCHGNIQDVIKTFQD